MFFIYSDNLKHGKIMIGVFSLLILQCICFLLEEFYGRLMLGELYPTEFIPLLFSLKPLLYSYTLITASFLHLNILHLIGNIMFFLAIARSLEKLFGTKLFIASYIFIGALAFIGSWLLHPESSVPIVGSSGAVSFLMGVYLIIFPHSKLKLIIIIPPLFKRILVPSYMFLLLWIGLQLYDIVSNNGETDGVAYATHILGFLIGIVSGLIWLEIAEDTEERINEIRG
jgi:membrane associated rhomboid family serine protease